MSQRLQPPPLQEGPPPSTSEEMRTGPDEDKAYTFMELGVRYKGGLSAVELTDY